MSKQRVPANNPGVVQRYWPAALVAVALLPPLFISSAMHAEIAICVLVAGLTAGWAIRLIANGELRVPLPLAGALAGFVGFLALRGLFAAEPVVAFAGGYSSDGTVFTFAAVACALFGLWAWPPAADDADASRSARVALFITVALYAAVSGVLAWRWGPTDPLGGPPSGLTPNSQYQVQLLTAGLSAAVAWGVTMRRSVTHISAAAVVAVIIAVNIQQCRSSVALPALLAAGAYALALLYIAGRPVGRLFPGAITALAGIGGVVLTMVLLVPSASVRAIPALDRLANGRGTLWASAAEVLAANPLVGRGLNHATAVTEWRLTATTFERVTTSDPHNLWFLVAVGGGMIGLVLLLALLYVAQRTLLDALHATPAPERAASCVLAGGLVALVVLSQFAFVYPLAWALAALLAGVALARVRPTLPARPRSVRDTALAVTAMATALALVGSIWLALPGRAEASFVSFASAWAVPAGRLQAQLDVIDRGYDLLPAEGASAVFSQWLAADRAAAEPYRAAFDERWARVEPHMAWDARVAVSALHLWMVDAEAGDADLARLTRIVDAGIEADPASGLWAASGAVFCARYGDEEAAARYAAMARENADWWRQTRASCDPGTFALVERLAQ